MYNLFLDRLGVAYKKSAGIPNGVYFWRSPEILTQDIQKWRCQRKVFVRVWQYKTPFLHGLCKSMNRKNCGKKNSVMVSGNYAIILGNYAVMLGNYAVMFGSSDVNNWCFSIYICFLLGKQSNKIKPRFQNLLPIQVHVFAFEPQRVHTYQWNWRSPKNDDDVAPGITA